MWQQDVICCLIQSKPTERSGRKASRLKRGRYVSGAADTPYRRRQLLPAVKHSNRGVTEHENDDMDGHNSGHID